MQTIYDFAGSTNMWSTSVGGHLMKVVNLTGFTVIEYEKGYERVRIDMEVTASHQCQNLRGMLHKLAILMKCIKTKHLHWNYKTDFVIAVNC
jgi:hypothetical protein